MPFGAVPDYATKRRVPNPYFGTLLRDEVIRWTKVKSVAFVAIWYLVWEFALTKVAAFVSIYLWVSSLRLGGVGQWIFAAMMALAFALLWFAYLIWGLRSLLDFQGVLFNSKLRDLLASRPDTLLDLSDPKCLQVVLYPTNTWLSWPLTAEHDAGFLLIHEQTSQLLIEADRYRYQIPLAAIRSIELIEYRRLTFEKSCLAVLRLRTGPIREQQLRLVPVTASSGEKVRVCTKQQCEWLLAQISAAVPGPIPEENEWSPNRSPHW